MSDKILKILEYFLQYPFGRPSKINKHKSLNLNRDELVEYFTLIENIGWLQKDEKNSMGSEEAYRLTSSGKKVIDNYDRGTKLDKILNYLKENTSHFYSLEEVCEVLNITFNEIYKLILEREGYIDNIAKAKDGDGFKITEEGKYFLKVDGGYTLSVNTEIEEIVNEKYKIKNPEKSTDKRVDLLNNHNMIFISHAKKNSTLVDRVVDKLLFKIFTVDSKNIFYTSKPKLGAKVSKRWRDEIREAIVNCEIFIPIITKDFKKSEMCISEVGGAWVLKKNIFPMILSPITFKNFGVVIDELQATKVDNKELIISFIDDLENVGGLKRKDGIDLDKIVNDYIRSIKRSLRINKKKAPPKLKNAEINRINEIRPFFRSDGIMSSSSEFKVRFLNEGAKARVIGINNLSESSSINSPKSFPIWCDSKQSLVIQGNWPNKMSQVFFEVKLLDIDDNKYKQIYKFENKKGNLSNSERIE